MLCYTRTIRIYWMDRGVRADGFSYRTPDYWTVGPASRYLDLTSLVSVRVPPMRDLPLNSERFEADRNDIFDAGDMVPCTQSTQEGRIAWDVIGGRVRSDTQRGRTWKREERYVFSQERTCGKG